MTTSANAKNNFWNGCVQHIREIYSGLKGKRVFIYGSGEFGRFLAKVLVDYDCVAPGDIKGFINDFQNGFCIDGIPVLAFEECDFSGRDYCVVVGVMMRSANVISRLEQKGIIHVTDTYSGIRNITGPMLSVFSGQSDVLNVGNMLAKIDRFHELNLPDQEMEAFYEDEQSLAVLHNRVELYRTGNFKLLDSICPETTVEYFGKGGLKVDENEIYVDCGAYDGDSVKDFIDASNGKYNRIIAFEPDKANYDAMQRNLTGISNIELVQAAVGEMSGETRFVADSQMGGCVNQELGTVAVRMVSLDDYFHAPVTFIKMDIEGAELDALRGAARLIKECHPKLAICVYHKVEDLYTIPKYIKSIVPEYRLKLRQHKPCIYGTVLYAEV